MCVAILQPIGHKVTDKTLVKCFRHNQHGAGLGWVENGEMQIKKGLMSHQRLVDVYNEIHAKNKNTPILIHCRLATVGMIGEPNCHPYKVKGGLLIHNGTFWNGAYQADKSDSRDFAETFHNELHKANVLQAKDALEKAITKRNKVVLLYKDKSYCILNEDMGHWMNGVWFSNDHWNTKL